MSAISILKPWRFFVQERIDLGDDGRRTPGVRENRQPQRDELRAGFGNGQCGSWIRTAHHDARDLDHRSPPLAEREVLGVRLRLDVAVELAEEDVVRSLL